MIRSRSTTFGLLLKRYRLSAGLSQEELAERARMTASGISALERGVRRVPHRETVDMLVEALGLNPDEQRLLALTVVRVRALANGIQSVVPSAIDSAGSTPFIGRDAELTTIRRFLGGDGPPALAFAGEPGIGKTRILDAAARLAVEGGWTVLRGGCHRRGGQDPYAPVLEALARHLLDQLVAQQRTTLQGCAWLVRLLPELSNGPIESLPSWDLSARQERRLIAAAVARYLANVAGEGGTLLVLDDLQWAGADALELLDVLIRAPASRPMRFVGAYRDVEVRPNAPLSVLLADLAHAGYVTHQTVAPLKAAQASLLLDAVLGADSGQPTALRERMIQRTGGVPFFLVTCAQERATGDEDVHLEDAIPWGVSHSIRQRVTALSENSRLVLAAAAVIGRSVDPVLLAQVVGRSAAEVADSLAESYQARLLDERADAYTFSHDLIREVLEEDVGSARRMLLHQRVGEVLEGTSDEPRIDLLAFHFARSRVVDKAIRYLEQAGDLAEARFAHAAAIDHYQDLVNILDHQGQKQEAARARTKLGLVLEYIGRYDAALAVLDQAAHAYQQLDATDSLALVVARIGIVLGHLGRPDDAIVRIEKLLQDVILDDSPRELITLYLAMAVLLYKSGRYRDELKLAQRATELAHRTGDDRALAEAYRLCGQAHQMQGHLEEALRGYETVIPLATSTGNLHCLARALNSVAHCELLRGRFVESRQNIDRALALAERLGEMERIVFFTMHRGFIAFFQGNWRQARNDGERALQLGHETGSPSLGSHPIMVIGQVAFGEGRWAEAISCLEKSVHLAKGSDPESLEIAQGVLAEIDVREGRPAAAIERLASLLGDERLERKNAGFLLPRLAWAYLEQEDCVRASDVARDAVAFARRSGARLHLVEALRVQALVVIHEQDWVAGRVILDEALDVARDIGYQHAEGRVLVLIGVIELKRDRRQQAHERFDAALAIFQHLGATRDAAETQRMVVSLD